MSGNPFRASVVPQYPAASPSSSFATESGTPEATLERGTNAVLDSSSTPSAKTKKSVRIESPTETIPPHPVLNDGDSAPLSPPSLNTINYASQSSPSAPEPNAAFSNRSKDDRALAGSISGQSDGRIMGEDSTGYSDAFESARPGGAPMNPFTKTLAHLEPRRMVDGELDGQSKERISGGEAVAGAIKATLDMEGFKNMLMSGISSPRGSGPPPQQNAPAANVINNAPTLESSSTDTSSTSRQSIFEPAQETLPESPHTIYDMATSDDEKTRRGGELSSKKEKRKSLPPPAPKSRHGKPVNSRTPRTVPFEDFAVTLPTANPALKKSEPDTNKPLPLTPPTISSPPNIIPRSSGNDLPESNKAEAADQFNAAPIPQKKVPPPVPLARRHSQLRNSTPGTRSRSNSSLTLSSQHSVELPILSPNLKEEPTSAASHKTPPPPPPTRHRGSALPTIGTSSANSSTTDISSSGTARRPTVTSPNPPSSRRTTLTSEPPSPKTSLGRTSSVHSTRSSHRIASNDSTSSILPPPPPPPRRRQSGRTPSDREQAQPSTPSSPVVENRRQSTEYKHSSPDSKRRTSVASESSLKYEYAPSSAVPPVDNEHPLYSPKEEEHEDDKITDVGKTIHDRATNRTSILDDMDKFQKEIEELRERYRHAA